MSVLNMLASLLPPRSLGLCGDNPFLLKLLLLAEASRV